jgi:type I site-specific restriction endonuclease
MNNLRDNQKKAVENLRFIDNKNEQQYIYFNIISQYLLKTIKLYNLRHTLVYLLNQAKAEILYKILQKAINDKKLKNEVEFILSDQKLFETYNGTSKILLTDDIFNEGIDIPICDSILFAEEINSKTAIVQNIGRSLRI